MTVQQRAALVGHVLRAAYPCVRFHILTNILSAEDETVYVMWMNGPTFLQAGELLEHNACRNSVLLHRTKGRKPRHLRLVE